jgi:predicted transcriptional regulator
LINIKLDEEEMTNEVNLERMLALLKLLADESRLRMLAHLAEGERSVGELAELVGISEPTASHHLRRLHAIGLVQMTEAGTSRIYRYVPQLLQQAVRELSTPARVAGLQGEQPEDAFRADVLRRYLIDGRLTKIPETRKKRRIILEWLVERFERDREYHEREVNAIILPIHPDSATLRRELIAEQLMTRERDSYCRC